MIESSRSRKRRPGSEEIVEMLRDLQLTVRSTIQREGKNSWTKVNNNNNNNNNNRSRKRRSGSEEIVERSAINCPIKATADQHENVDARIQGEC